MESLNLTTLEEKVRETVRWYAANGIRTKSYFLADPAQKVYAVTILDTSPKHRPAGIVVIARIEEDYVIIEEDRTDKPLVERLVDAGVPREKIIEYYAGEPLPEGLKQPADLSIP